MPESTNPCRNHNSDPAGSDLGGKASATWAAEGDPGMGLNRAVLACKTAVADSSGRRPLVACMQHDQDKQHNAGMPWNDRRLAEHIVP